MKRNDIYKRSIMNQRVYLVTGVTGSGRKEVLKDLKSFAKSKNKIANTDFLP